jgi:hypothetical protein
VQQPLEVWLGGSAPAALERCGRLSDGQLPSLCTPEEAKTGRVAIDEAAARAGRSLSGEHFGMSIGYATAPIDPATARTMTARRPRSLELTPVGWPALRKKIKRFIDVGFSKFVVRPIVAPPRARSALRPGERPANLGSRHSIGSSASAVGYALRASIRSVMFVAHEQKGALRAWPPPFGRAERRGPRRR